MMGYYEHGMMGYGLGLFMMICMIALTILAVVALVRYLHQSDKPHNQIAQNNALNILNERYAKGELTEEEYRNKKKQIQS